LERIGRGFWRALQQGYELTGSLGLVVFETIATIIQPKRFRLAALVHQMEETGLNALPIVGLLSFLVGEVFAYQGSDSCVSLVRSCSLLIYSETGFYEN